MANLSPDNILVLRDNAIVSCLQAGIYIQGAGSQPLILHNVFMVCKCPAVYLEEGVLAFVTLNEMQVNHKGIMLVNNSSMVF